MTMNITDLCSRDRLYHNPLWTGYKRADADLQAMERELAQAQGIVSDLERRLAGQDEAFAAERQQVEQAASAFIAGEASFESYLHTRARYEQVCRDRMALGERLGAAKVQAAYLTDLLPIERRVVSHRAQQAGQDLRDK